eukprot:gnl/MRDRNA2_/MRDRNA2_73822_c0_seq4.p1 gnl/MRDRNA2_/MRDRNA2_73822_c0~~gnl/MRDRNA2_/MRDRNA2_73822_c0_seq4.p1  ORF type:complete len:140 (+),score=13.11 gnl/MRDRNA2_/MRDRNA2_73822_c0_seq4:387-806(+)
MQIAHASPRHHHRDLQYSARKTEKGHSETREEKQLRKDTRASRHNQDKTHSSLKSHGHDAAASSSARKHHRSRHDLQANSERHSRCSDTSSVSRTEVRRSPDTRSKTIKHHSARDVEKQRKEEPSRRHRHGGDKSGRSK